jgi:hypothetical protein
MTKRANEQTDTTMGAAFKAVGFVSAHERLAALANKVLDRSGSDFQTGAKALLDEIRKDDDAAELMWVLMGDQRLRLAVACLQPFYAERKARERDEADRRYREELARAAQAGHTTAPAQKPSVRPAQPSAKPAGGAEAFEAAASAAPALPRPVASWTPSPRPAEPPRKHNEWRNPNLRRPQETESRRVAAREAELIEARERRRMQSAMYTIGLIGHRTLAQLNGREIRELRARNMTHGAWLAEVEARFKVPDDLTADRCFADQWETVEEIYQRAKGQHGAL